MKKQLLCTSAIALGVAAAPAAAQEWSLDWGGFMSQHVAIVDNGGTLGNAAGTDLDGVAHHQTGEIIFSPSVTLDNGLTFGVNVQYEAQQAVSVDETYVTISSDTFGKLDIGAENSAGYKSMVAAPGVTSMAINSPSISAFVPFAASGGTIGNSFLGAGLSAYTEVGYLPLDGNNDPGRISYYTPSFNGLVVGVSYARTVANNANSAGASDKNAVALSDVFDIGVNYSQSFGKTDVSLSARYGTADATAPGRSDPDTWGIGAQVGFGAITVGGHYAENDNGGAGGAFDESGWSLGATYDAAGPWSFEALTFQGEFDNGGGVDDEYQAYRIGASRDLGPGVDWDIYAANVVADGQATAGDEFDGTLIGTAINLSF